MSELVLWMSVKHCYLFDSLWLSDTIDLGQHWNHWRQHLACRPHHPAISLGGVDGMRDADANGNLLQMKDFIVSGMAENTAREWDAILSWHELPDRFNDPHGVITGRYDHATLVATLCWKSREHFKMHHSAISFRKPWAIYCASCSSSEDKLCNTHLCEEEHKEAECNEL